jgi:hypothetical protein
MTCPSIPMFPRPAVKVTNSPAEHKRTGAHAVMTEAILPGEPKAPDKIREKASNGEAPMINSTNRLRSMAAKMAPDREMKSPVPGRDLVVERSKTDSSDQFTQLLDSRLTGADFPYAATKKDQDAVATIEQFVQIR